MGTGINITQGLFTTENLIVVLCVIIFFTLLFGMLYFRDRSKYKLQSNTIKDFGSSNGYAYMADGDLSSVDAKFLRGSDQQMVNLLIGNYQNTPIKIFDYIYTLLTLSRTYRTVANAVEFTLQTTLPSMIIARKGLINDDVYYSVNLNEYAKITSDIDGRFNVYAQKGKEDEVKGLLSSDFKQLFKQIENINFEIKENKLYTFRLDNFPHVVDLKELQNRIEMGNSLVKILTKEL